MNERGRTESGGLLDPTVSVGRIAGVRIGFNWSWAIVFALIVWSLGASYFPSRYPFLSGAAYLVNSAMVRADVSSTTSTRTRRVRMRQTAEIGR